MGNIICIIILLLLVTLCVRSLITEHKRGKSCCGSCGGSCGSCGGSCAGCSGCGSGQEIVVTVRKKKKTE